eukprot:10262592-Alexandrium_andersonii.AAC.1
MPVVGHSFSAEDTVDFLHREGTLAEWLRDGAVTAPKLVPGTRVAVEWVFFFLFRQTRGFPGTLPAAQVAAAWLAEAWERGLRE